MPYSLNQTVNLTSANWELEIYQPEVCVDDYCLYNTWKQKVDLRAGLWRNELWIADTLVWTDSWSTNSTDWDIDEPVEHHLDAYSSVYLLSEMEVDDS